MSDPTMGESGNDHDMTIDGMGDIVALLSEITDADRHRIEPPQSIWNAIVDTVSTDRDGHPNREVTLTDDGHGSVVVDISSVESAVEKQATTTITLATRTRQQEPHGLPPDTGGWRRQWLPVAAAVAITIVGGLVTWAVSDEITGQERATASAGSDDAGDVVAVTDITNDGLPEPAEVEGEVRLVRSGDLHYVDVFLDLDATEAAPESGFYELWVIDTDVERMISLGVVTGTGRHVLPPNLDPADFPVVDISVEPADGDPTHSGRSIWRGVLDL